METKKISYACVAGVIDERSAPGARCMSGAEKNGRCKEHQDAEQFPKALRPTRILVRLHIPERLMTQGLYQILQKELHQKSDTPPTGTEVWCGNGIAYVTAKGLLHEIFGEGEMKIRSLHLWQKPTPPGVRQDGKKDIKKAYLLEVEFVHSPLIDGVAAEYASVHKEITALLEMIWEAYVHCNIQVQGENDEQYVLHVVNLRNPQRFYGTLHYFGGDWGVEGNKE